MGEITVKFLFRLISTVVTLIPIPIGTHLGPSHYTFNS